MRVQPKMQDGVAPHATDLSRDFVEMCLPGNLGKCNADKQRRCGRALREPATARPEWRERVCNSKCAGNRMSRVFGLIQIPGPFIVAPSSDPVCTVKVEKCNLVSREYKAGRCSV